jgi:glycosyltransferase involved in cell wall biosynthesis
MRILMVCTEYPPMKGASGPYVANLTRTLRKEGIEVYVVCNERGDGDFSGISPTNKENSEVLLQLVDKIKPDIVHIQFEGAFYGLVLQAKGATKSGTYIDTFYSKCDVPIVTTIFSAFSFSDWMEMYKIDTTSLIKKSGRIGELGIPARALIRWLKYNMNNISNYRSFKNITKQKARMSQANIVFSRHLSKILDEPEAKVIHMGSDIAISPKPNKNEARAKFSLPQDSQRIALALGFAVVNKGWDIIDKMKIPSEWVVVTNSNNYPGDHYNIKKNVNFKLKRHDKIINLHRGFLSDEELSTLFYASDAVILPYRMAAASAVMFNALGHGLPFVASDLKFFREFSRQGLGITVKRTPNGFAKGLKDLDKNYTKYAAAVDAFSYKLKWDYIARQHISIYESLASKTSISTTKAPSTAIDYS